jgi:hypothetical protein
LRLGFYDEVLENILGADGSAKSPQYDNSLTPLARLRLKPTKPFLFCNIWEYNTSEGVRKY